MTNIIEFKNSIPNKLCDEIISLFEKKTEQKFNIPKNSPEWNKIEQFLYKDLLLKLNKYKNLLLSENSNGENETVTSSLNLNTYLNDFKIIKYDPVECETIIRNYEKNENRYNIVSFVFYLNDVESGGEIIFKKSKMKPERGKLVIFPEISPNSYKCQMPISNSQYIITGQICENTNNI